MHMASELLIRAGLNDGRLIEDLLARHSSPFHQPSLSRVVVDAQTTVETDVFHNAAQSAGVSFVVDPQTILLQGTVRDGDRWLQLPYGASEPVDVSAWSGDGSEIDALVEKVVVTQIQAHATVIMPPYFVVDRPDSPVLDLGIEAVAKTAAFCSRNGIGLKLMPLLCAQIKTFGPENTWAAGIDRFATTLRDLPIDSVAACLGPAGDGDDSVSKVTNVFNSLIRLQNMSGHPVVAWRQGVLGPGLVAAGLSGYECGAGIGEQSQPTQMKRAHEKKGGGPGGIYLEPLGRSVGYAPARILLANLALRPKIMCDVESCCPSVSDTLDNPKPHAIRTRARQLRRVDEMGDRRWRLNHIAIAARAAHTLAVQANKVLDAEYQERDVERRIMLHPKVYESLSEVCSGIGGSGAKAF